MLKSLFSILYFIIITSVFSQNNPITNVIVGTLHEHFQNHRIFEDGTEENEPIYVMPDIFNIYPFFPNEIIIHGKKIKILKDEEMFLYVINNTVHYYHVSLNIENNKLVVYLQQGLGIRYNGNFFRYEVKSQPNDDCSLIHTEDSVNVWESVLSIYLSDTMNTSGFLDTVPIVFGRYKYGYNINDMHLPEHIDKYTIMPVSQFSKEDGYYIDFYDDYKSKPFLVTDVTYNIQGKILVIIRKIDLSNDAIKTYINGIFNSDSFSVYELDGNFITKTAIYNQTYQDSRYQPSLMFFKNQ